MNVCSPNKKFLTLPEPDWSFENGTDKTGKVLSLPNFDTAVSEHFLFPYYVYRGVGWQDISVSFQFLPNSLYERWENCSCFPISLFHLHSFLPIVALQWGGSTECKQNCSRLTNRHWTFKELIYFQLRNLIDVWANFFVCTEYFIRVNIDWFVCLKHKLPQPHSIPDTEKSSLLKWTQTQRTLNSTPLKLAHSSWSTSSQPFCSVSCGSSTIRRHDASWGECPWPERSSSIASPCWALWWCCAPFAPLPLIAINTWPFIFSTISCFNWPSPTTLIHFCLVCSFGSSCSLWPPIISCSSNWPNGMEWSLWWPTMFTWSTRTIWWWAIQNCLASWPNPSGHWPIAVIGCTVWWPPFEHFGSTMANTVYHWNVPGMDRLLEWGLLSTPQWLNSQWSPSNCGVAFFWWTWWAKCFILHRFVSTVTLSIQNECIWMKFVVCLQSFSFPSLQSECSLSYGHWNICPLWLG